MRKELTSFIEAIKVNQPKNLRFEHRELEGEGHMSSPLLSNYYGLKFIFSDMALPSALVNDFNEDIFLKHEQHIMTKYGSQAKQSAEAYVNLVFRLINKEQFKDAITVIQRSIEAYDYDIWLRNLLASTYEKNNQITEAIEAYKAAIDVSKKYKFGKEAEFQGHIDRLIKIE
jgi:tetratricopeptide (TPR) repeat protein